MRHDDQQPEGDVRSWRRRIQALHCTEGRFVLDQIDKGHKSAAFRTYDARMIRTTARHFFRWLRRVAIALLVLLLGPGVMLVTGDVVGADWRSASRKPAGLAPDPSENRQAVVQVYAARAFSWRGAFGVHTWIAVKPTDAEQYTVYHILGWRTRYSGSGLAIGRDQPDRHWFGAEPQVLAQLEGEGVDDIIARIDAAARRYPYDREYGLWPGPNSNTFTSWVARQVPELRLDLPPTAIGKDYLGHDTFFDRAVSGTGYQASLFGLIGVTLAVEEGLEINLAGMTFGIDPNDLNLKLPGVGRVGPAPDPVRLLRQGADG